MLSRLVYTPHVRTIALIKKGLRLYLFVFMNEAVIARTIALIKKGLRLLQTNLTSVLKSVRTIALIKKGLRPGTSLPASQRSLVRTALGRSAEERVRFSHDE